MPTTPKLRPVLPASGETLVYHTLDGAPYVLCNSTEPFINPTSPNDTPADENESTESRNKYCEQVNQTLNLDLGQTFVTRNNRLGGVLLFICRWVDILFFEWYESIPMYIWSEIVPLSFKRALTRSGWNVYLAIHTAFLGKTTGLHPSQSLDYHAMTTMMFQSQFLAWTPRRMRFFLKEVNSSAPNDPPTPERIKVMDQDMTVQPFDVTIPTQQVRHRRVEGWYIRQSNDNNCSTSNKSNPTTNASQKNTRKGTIFWIYGGAYLAGDSRGNSSAADYLANHSNMNTVFVPTFRLAPEADLFDVLWDICLAFYWLQCELEQKSKSTGQPVEPIYIVGISSGAAIATRLVQLMAQQGRKEDLNVPNYFALLVQRLNLSNVGGAVLFNPYVDYTQLYEHERKGSFLHYAKHDLVVNQAVQEYGLPYLKNFIPTLEQEQQQEGDNQNAARDDCTARRTQSPIHLSCKGLPPLCVVASEHEAVYDMTCTLVNQARSEGVPVTFGVWKFMCHVFTILHGFLPEGQLSMDFVVDWIRKEQEKRQQETK